MENQLANEFGEVFQTMKSEIDASRNNHDLDQFQNHSPKNHNLTPIEAG